MTSSPSASDKRLRILHTNDLHGHFTPPRAEALRPVRAQCDLYFDCGDLIKTGNLGVPLSPDPAWARLALLHCSASVIGNRETHLMEIPFRAKLDGATHPVLCANLRRASGAIALPGTWSTTIQGLRVVVVGVSVAMVTKRMAASAISAYLWEDPIATAMTEAERLRSQADVLIALTHIGLTQDKRLAEATELYDLILGGHSHDVVSPPVQIGRTWIGQAGSHGRFYGLYEYDAAHHTLTGEVRPWLT